MSVRLELPWVVPSLKFRHSTIDLGHRLRQLHFPRHRSSCVLSSHMSGPLLGVMCSEYLLKDLVGEGPA
jgi:hypothetical protein